MSISLNGDYLNPNKIVYCFAEKINDYMRGKRNFAPWSVEIHPTSKCNYKCIFCSYKERNEKRLELDKRVMEELINSLINMKVKGVYFSGGGESSIYPDIAAHIEKLYKNGVETAMITNGSYLNEAGIIDIAHMMNYIALSISSVNPDNYKKITNSSQLEVVLNVPSEIKKRHKNDAPVLGARIVITNLILSEIENILRVLKERQFDYALFKIARDYEDRGLGLNSDEEKHLSETLIKLNERKMIDDNFTNLNNIFAHKKEATNTNKCFINEMGLLATVDSDGRVYPNIVEIGNQDFCVGDLNVLKFENIWHGKAHEKVKQASDIKCTKDECKNCRAMSYNNIISSIIGSLPSKRDSFI